MTAMSLISRLRERARTFCLASAGNVSITFALATIPIIGVTGAAVDYSRASSARTAMQAAVDSTALILSKEAQNLTAAELNAKALTYFMANFHRPDVKSIVVTPTFTTVDQGSFKLDLASAGSLDTTFAGIWTPTMNIGAKTEVLWGMKKLELALALDNTGSMASSQKMKNLKKAAKSLLETLKKAAKKDGDVKVAIIPFDTSVRLSEDPEDDGWNKDFFDWDQIDCNGGDWGKGCSSSTWMKHWDGCVRDRTYPYDAQDTAPDKTKQDTLFPAKNGCRVSTILPLTTDWNALDNKVDDMEPIGNTNVSIGLAWGWHALTTGAPLTQAAAPATDLDKVLIILTDGDNTESWDNSKNDQVKSSKKIDDRTKLACSNIKANNIKIYAIRVIDGNADLLKQCATNPSMYYDVQDASQLNTVFSAIAQNLANLRLAK